MELKRQPAYDPENRFFPTLRVDPTWEELSCPWKQIGGHRSLLPFVKMAIQKEFACQGID